jgi:hypothetical protein
MLMCATCINNTPPHDDNMYDANPNDITDDDIYDELPVTNPTDNYDDMYDELPATNLNNIYDELPATNPNIIYNEPMNIIHDIANDFYIYYTPIVAANIPPLEPPAHFDMNTASLVEENPDYMDELINGEVEYNGRWYFALDDQIYSVPYEIEVDDDYVRQDILESWDGVQWAGTIFGNYVAWY